MHDCFGHAVLDALADDVKVGLDQPLDHFAVTGLFLVQLARGAVRRYLRKKKRLSILQFKRQSFLGGGGIIYKKLSKV